jgi:hypothetical protein
MTTPAAFMKAAPKPLNSNTAWGARYGAEIRRVVQASAAQAPRSLQRHLGPSEIGYACDRRVVAKLAGLPRTNHTQDPWPAILGTAGHAWLESAFRSENDRLGRIRWVPEARVTPIDGHPGTADLYDVDEFACVDHKILGPTSMAKIRSASGPPRHYQTQLLAYARGFRRLGLPVNRVVILAYPRTSSTLDGLYVWERVYTPADDVLLDEVAARLDVRKQWAAAVITGSANLMDVPADIEDCHFCEQFRPQSARDGGVGCPGNAQPSTSL